MPTHLLEIDPVLVGPLSLKTATVVKHLRAALGLTLREAKDAVDVCVFEGGAAMFHMATLTDAQTLKDELESLGRVHRVQLVARIAGPHEPSPPSKTSTPSPAVYLAPDLCSLATPLRATFPQLEDDDLDRLFHILGGVLYTPRRYLAGYRAGLLTSVELRDKLLAHIQTETSAALSRAVAVTELEQLKCPLEELLFSPRARQ